MPAHTAPTVKDLLKSEISEARQLAAATVNDDSQSDARRRQAIELDNWVTGESPMPAGGAREVRQRMRVLRLVTGWTRVTTQQPLTRAQKEEAVPAGATIE